MKMMKKEDVGEWILTRLPSFLRECLGGKPPRKNRESQDEGDTK